LISDAAMADKGAIVTMEDQGTRGAPEALWKITASDSGTNYWEDSGVGELAARNLVNVY
jgi:hypothetical protein